MFRTRIIKIGSLAAFVAGAPGCGGEAPATNASSEVDPELGIVMDGLGTAIAACNDEQAEPTGSGVYDTAAKTLGMTLEGGTAVFSVVGTSLTVNGWPCYDTNGVAMTTSNVKKLNITSASGSADKVVFDLMPGSFGSIFSTSGGVSITMAHASDEFALRGSAGNNSMKVGQNAAGNAIFIEASGDTKADIRLTGAGLPDLLTFALGAGNDTFTGDAVSGVSAAHIDSTVTTLSKLALADLVVYGGDGQDTLSGGNGDDELHGGADNDILLAGGSGDGADLYSGGGNGLTGGDTISYASRMAAVHVDINPDIMGTTGTVNVASLTFPLVGIVSLDCDSNGAEPVDLATTADIDAMVTALDGTNCDASLNSMNQVVVSATTSVVVANGAGDGADVLGLAVGTHVGDDADDGEAGEGDDVLSDVENIIGGGGADELVGSTGPNVITGGGGADVISGGDAGNCTTDIDVLNGGDGDDVFMMGPEPDCGDTVNGGAGTDRADYQYRTAILRISINNAADDGDDNDNDGETDEGDNIKNDVEQLFGGSANDVIVGGTGNDDIRGGAGNDVLSGGGGNDTLIGHAGNDTLNGDAGDDVFPCEGEDTDYISHSEADREMGAGEDIMNGGAGTRDKVDYEGRTDALAITMCQDTSAVQGAADDTEPAACVDLDGTMDAPVLTGTVDLTAGAPGAAAGTVTIEFLGEEYVVTWDGSENTAAFEALFDTALAGSGLVASLTGTPELVLTPTLAPGDLSINVTGAQNEAVFGVGNTSTTAAPEGDQVVNVEWGVAGDGADILTGSAAADTLEGRGGADTISGGAGNDTLYGDDGLDNIDGDAGDDTLDGGDDADNDVLDGGDGDGDMCVVTGNDTTNACEIE